MKGALGNPLFRRFFLACALFILAITVASGVFAASRIRSDYLGARELELRDEARLVAALVNPDSPADLDRNLKSIGTGIAHRVTIVTLDGKVLADSRAHPATMDNLRLNPEIMQAVAQGEGREIQAIGGEDILYVAVRPTGAAWLVRLSVPLTGLGREIGFLVAGLAAVSAGMLALAALVSSWIAKRTENALADLAALASAYTRQEFAKRSSLEDRGALGVLTRTLNALGDTLAQRFTEGTRRREELQAILAGVAEGVIATDRNQRVLLVNPGAAQLLDFPGGSAEGKALWETIREEQVLKSATEVLETGKRRQFQIGPIQNRYLEVAVSAWPPDGKPEGLVIIAHDSTEAVRYQELRKEFVANVSHELRTPLTFIKGFVETLRDGAMADPVKGPEYLATIEKHVDQLSSLVTNLLELSRLERGPGLMRRKEVDLPALIRKTAEFMEPAARRKNQKLELDLHGSEGPILGDPDYLERAVGNLIDNAIKYTPEAGTVTVRFRHGEDRILIEVQDTGIGIPAEDIPRIFERFYRVDKSRSREMGGTGLGLSIVKHVVLAHAGTVEARSEPGKGSTFVVTLPSTA